MADSKETKKQYKAKLEAMTEEQLRAELAKVKAEMVKSGLTAEQVDELERAIKSGQLARHAAKAFFGVVLPALALDAFQLFLIIEKLWGLAPFGHLPWLAILLPTAIPVAVNSLRAIASRPKPGK